MEVLGDRKDDIGRLLFQEERELHCTFLNTVNENFMASGRTRVEEKGNTKSDASSSQSKNVLKDAKLQHGDISLKKAKDDKNLSVVDRTLTKKATERNTFEGDCSHLSHAAFVDIYKYQRHFVLELFAHIEHETVNSRRPPPFDLKEPYWNKYLDRVRKPKKDGKKLFLPVAVSESLETKAPDNFSQTETDGVKLVLNSKPSLIKRVLKFGFNTTNVKPVENTNLKKPDVRVSHPKKKTCNCCLIRIIR